MPKNERAGPPRTAGAELELGTELEHQALAAMGDGSHLSRVAGGLLLVA